MDIARIMALTLQRPGARGAAIGAALAARFAHSSAATSAHQAHIKNNGNLHPGKQQKIRQSRARCRCTARAHRFCCCIHARLGGDQA
jgi:hypothetical protein